MPAGAEDNCIREGLARIHKQGVVGKIEPNRKRPEAGSDGPKDLGTLFYNPAQVFNRDLSLIAIKVFGQRRVGDAINKAERYGSDIVRIPSQVKGLQILEPLAATGLRSIRYALELPHSIFAHITTADMDPSAVEGAVRNMELNNVPSNLMNTYCTEATRLMHCGEFICGTEQWDVVDIDPYGTAAPFMESALRATRDGGLLCVTSTDMPVLGGNTPEVAFYKYGGSTVKARYLHEMALRLVIHQLQMTAAKNRRYVQPLLSISVDFYVRIFVQVSDKPLLCASLASQTATVVQCCNCDWFVVLPFGQFVERGNKSHTERAAKRRRPNPDVVEVNSEGADAAEPPPTDVSKDLEESLSEKVEDSAEMPQQPAAPNLATVSFPGSAADGRKFILGRLPSYMPAEGRCPECKGALQMAGPFYAGPLHDQSFLSECIKEMDRTLGDLSLLKNEPLETALLNAETRKTIARGECLKEVDPQREWFKLCKERFEYEMSVFKFSGLSRSVFDKIRGVLSACQDELPDVPLFYKLTSICNQARISMIKLDRLKSALMHKGYRVGLFHREPLSVKTNAPPEVIYDLIRAWIKKERSNQPNAFQKVPPNFLRDVPEAFDADWSYHPALADSRKTKGRGRWMPNPERHWGPGKKPERE